MKLLFATAVLCVTLGNAMPSTTDTLPFNEKEKTDRKKGSKEEEGVQNKNLHSVKKWKMTIEYANGTIISKTIVVNKNSELSALETAFKEADKHLDDMKNVKDFSISPVPSSYVLLAGD